MKGRDKTKKIYFIIAQIFLRCDSMEPHSKTETKLICYRFSQQVSANRLSKLTNRITEWIIATTQWDAFTEMIVRERKRIPTKIKMWHSSQRRKSMNYLAAKGQMKRKKLQITFIRSFWFVSDETRQQRWKVRRKVYQTLLNDGTSSNLNVCKVE